MVTLLSGFGHRRVPHLLSNELAWRQKSQTTLTNKEPHHEQLKELMLPKRLTYVGLHFYDDYFSNKIR